MENLHRVLLLYISGGHDNIEKKHFEEHKWLMNVFCR